MKNWREVIRPVENIAGLKGHVELQIREPEELRAVAERALTWTCDDPVWAKKLLRKVELAFYGRPWGSELMVSDKGTDLVDAGMITSELDRIARLNPADWRAELAASIVEGVMTCPFDTPLFLVLAKDLGGEAVLAEVTAQVTTLGLTISTEMMKVARESYEKMAGRSFWEMEEEVIFWSFSLTYLFWKMNMAESLELWEAAADEDVDFEVGSRADEILVATRVRARDLARVILGRGMITPDQGMGYDWGTITYEDLLELLN